MTETSEDTSSKDNVVQETTTEEEETFTSSPPPSMTVSLVVYWIIPLVVLGLLSRIGHEPMEVPTFKNIKSKPIVLPKPSSPPTPLYPPVTPAHQQQHQQQQQQPSASPRSRSTTTAAPSKMPSSYQQVVNDINAKRRKISFQKLKKDTPSQESQQPQRTTSPSAMSSTRGTDSSQHQQSSTSEPLESSSSPERTAVDQALKLARQDYMNDPSNVYKMINLADAMRARDLVVHDGGSIHAEAIQLYENIVIILKNKRRRALEAGEITNVSKMPQIKSVKDEVFLPYDQKSLDGTLVAVLVAKGKQYFMANMFEKAVESYEAALEIEPAYLDALGSKASSQIILGQYEDAANAYFEVMELDKYENPIFTDTFTGLAKILSAKEDVVENGWSRLVSRIESILPSLENIHRMDSSNKHLTDTLSKMHNTLFTYHDTKTKDYTKAWYHLSTGFKHKMSMLQPWNAPFEQKKVAMMKNIFKQGFWPDNVGLSDDENGKTPIFIIGFPRSGSTLLERVLDSHSQVVGTGEDSVFNGRLEQIRNQIVKASMTGSVDMIRSVVDHEAKAVLEETVQRWKTIEATKQKVASSSSSSSSTVDANDTIQTTPKRFTDKMLTNYFNVGFIHMLLPHALILHVARNPMDVLFSSYKHEFPAGTLDYTSEFPSLADLYLSYREVIEHWDAVLPGRVTHVRYEDLVNDMPGMARAVIEATGLEWEDDVLEFHKKKHAVNTHSTTQVRKGIYKTAVEAWKRYEEPLQPLRKLVGEKVDWKLKTTLPSYVPPPVSDDK